jgi:hypothetical protein
MAELTLNNDMRVGLIGRTRSGKSFLAESLLAGQKRVLIIDSKGDVEFPGYFLTSNPAAALLEPKTIFRPDGPIHNSFWEDAMWHIHEQGGGIIYVDEMSEVCTANTMPAGLRSIFRMGGGLGVGLWYSAQSATEITNTSLRQSDVIIMFLNIGASDRDKLMKITGDIAEVTAKLPLHHFVVYESANQSYDPDAIPSYKYNADVVMA